MMETESVLEMSADLNKLTQLSACVEFNVHSTRDSGNGRMEKIT
jgi:hypothetical protein